MNSFVLVSLFISIISCVQWNKEFPPGMAVNDIFKKIYSSLSENNTSPYFSILPDNPYFAFVPTNVINARENETAIYEDSDFTYSFTPELDDTNLVLHYTVHRKKLFAASNFLFFLPERIIPHEFLFDGNHKLTFHHLSENEIAFFKVNGIRIYRNNHGLLETLYDMARTINMFVSFFTKKVLTVTEKENLKFLKTLGYEYEKRDASVFGITADDVHSGDIFASLRMDGIDPLVIASTGSRIAHIQIALKINGTMNICESQDAGYWPVAGWQCNKFEDFEKWIKDGEFNVVHLRLAEPYRSNFNETRAWEWLQPLLGSPYGFEQFIFAALDTPAGNLFGNLDIGSLDLAYFFADLVAKDFADLVIGRGLRYRLNLPQVPVISRADLYGIFSKQGKSFPEVYIIPETGEARYGEDGHISRVCSCFATELLVHSGAFEGTNFDVPFYPAEQTPADLIHLKLWDLESPLPEQCVKNDPMLKYCQPWGKYRISFAEDEVGTYDPYPNMNNYCPSSPHYHDHVQC